MKRIIYRVLAFLCVLSLLACMFIAYAEMNAEKESEEKGGTPIDYGFYLTMESEGDIDLATAREKTGSDSYAYYLLSTITNTYNLPIYINVRNQAGTIKVGTAAHTIPYGTGTPYPFNISYKSGYGDIGTYYRPSGQTNSNSPVGAYVQGLWHP